MSFVLKKIVNQSVRCVQGRRERCDYCSERFLYVATRKVEAGRQTVLGSIGSHHLEGQVRADLMLMMEAVAQCRNLGSLVTCPHCNRIQTKMKKHYLKDRVKFFFTVALALSALFGIIYNGIVEEFNGNLFLSVSGGLLLLAAFCSIISYFSITPDKYKKFALKDDEFELETKLDDDSNPEQILRDWCTSSAIGLTHEDCFIGFHDFTGENFFPNTWTFSSLFKPQVKLNMKSNRKKISAKVEYGKPKFNVEPKKKLKLKR